MPLIHLCGPNAIGKTTAVRRWAARYGSICLPISLDLLRNPGFDTVEDKITRCKEYAASDQVVVVESARTTQVLSVVSCDTGGQGIELQNGSPIEHPRRWKGTEPEKRDAVLSDRSTHPIAVCESARTTTTTTYALADEPVIIVTCGGELMGRHLRARCEARGKQFREDYWNIKKLDYEGTARYLNFARKRLRPEQVKHFVIADQARDWPAVDEYFGQVFRRLLNKLIRERR